VIYPAEDPHPQWNFSSIVL